MATTSALKLRDGTVVQLYRVRLGGRLRLVTVPPRECPSCGEYEGRGRACAECARTTCAFAAETAQEGP